MMFVFFFVVSCFVQCSYAASGCVSHVFNEGDISSNNYPSPYIAGLKCRTWIHAPANKIVKLTVTSVGLASGDKVRIYDGLTHTDPHLVTLSSNTNPGGIYQTSSTKAYVAFSTDRHDDGGSGYQINVQFVENTIAPWTDAPCGQIFGNPLTFRKKEIGAVFGGQAAEVKQFPWQVLIGLDGYLLPFCGGSVINDRWIISAAHCLFSFDVPDAEFHVGRLDLTDQAEPGTQLLTAEKIIRHPGYNQNTNDNDIELIKTNEVIQFNNYVQPICQPGYQESFIGEMAIASGWGNARDQPGDPTYWPDILQYTNLTILSNADCHSETQGFFPITDDLMICATDAHNSLVSDTCQGDSGGPLSVQRVDDTYTLVGLTSFGYSCAAGVPGVYTAVSYMLSWIQDTINAN